MSNAHQDSSGSFFSNHLTFFVSVLMVILFVATTDMPELYFSNQNTKFLHGMAQAFPQRLGNDWTAGTVDGLPVFSSLIYLLSRFGDNLSIYSTEIVLLSVLAWSLLRLAQIGAAQLGNSFTFLLLALSILTITAWPPLSEIYEGVAGQYITKGYLQPSEFGVFFILGLVLAQRGHNAAIFVVAIPALFHPGYVSFALILVGVTWWHRRKQEQPLSTLIVLSALLLIFIPSIDLAFRFTPTNKETFSTAADILALERIPHHSNPRLWAGLDSLCRLFLVIGAIFSLRSGILKSAMIAMLVFGVSGALLVIVTNNSSIALLAPWRISVILVPASYAILIGSGLGWLLPRLPERIGNVFAILLLACAFSVARSGFDTKKQLANGKELPAYLLHIRNNFSPSNIYLTNPLDQSFRLNALAAQFVSWKTHPYLDSEVLEWQRRIDLSRSVFENDKGLNCKAIEEIASLYPVSHLVLNQNSRKLSPCLGFVLEFQGPEGAVFKLP